MKDIITVADLIQETEDIFGGWLDNKDEMKHILEAARCEKNGLAQINTERRKKPRCKERPALGR